MGDVGRTSGVILDMEASFTVGGTVVGTGAGACQYFTPP